jgi:hypothetical protein
MNKRGYSSLEFILVISLLLAITVSGFLLVENSSKILNKLNESKEISSDMRIIQGYLGNKLKQQDLEGMFRVDQVDDIKALVISEEISGTLYETWVLENNGYLVEVFKREEDVIDLQMNFPIAMLANFDVSINNGLIQIDLKDLKGDKRTSFYKINSYKEDFYEK